MKILDNSIVRDMTAEEEEAFIAAHQNQDEPIDEAGPEDYEQALEEMGVDFND